MNFHNRISTATGDEVLRRSNRLKIELYQCDSHVEGTFELHGDLSPELDDNGHAVAPTDLTLLLDLLGRFQRKGVE
jgi:hypothetical protein